VGCFENGNKPAHFIKYGDFLLPEKLESAQARFSQEVQNENIRNRLTITEKRNLQSSNITGH
jgi:hypothetical protein